MKLLDVEFQTTPVVRVVDDELTLLVHAKSGGCGGRRGHGAYVTTESHVIRRVGPPTVLAPCRKGVWMTQSSINPNKSRNVRVTRQNDNIVIVQEPLLE